MLIISARTPDGDMETTRREEGGGGGCLLFANERSIVAIASFATLAYEA